MGKLKNFLFSASGVVIDAAAGAANDTIQDKVADHNQRSAEKKQMKKTNYNQKTR
ncbi:MAG: hypothetical protein LUG91_11365 [Ruminococcus sp.]|nr:hypothetical protein [Ruminococcus sp.]